MGGNPNPTGKTFENLKYVGAVDGTVTLKSSDESVSFAGKASEYYFQNADENTVYSVSVIRLAGKRDVGGDGADQK
jgi:hypothetical protein